MFSMSWVQIHNLGVGASHDWPLIKICHSLRTLLSKMLFQNVTVQTNNFVMCRLIA